MPAPAFSAPVGNRSSTPNPRRAGGKPWPGIARLVKRLLPARVRAFLGATLHRLRHTRWKGLRLGLDYPDRILLEDTILPHLRQQAGGQRILFIGCDWYTRHYPAMFKDHEFWTIDIDPAKARHGSRKHIVDGLEHLSKHFEEGYFDVIIHTGVFGWGVNTREHTEQTFEECRRCLRPGGLMVFGWDDVPEYRSFPVIEECEALRGFAPEVFPPLGAHQHLAADDELRHTFNFFRKPSIWLAKLNLCLHTAFEEAMMVLAIV